MRGGPAAVWYAHTATGKTVMSHITPPYKSRQHCDDTFIIKRKHSWLDAKCVFVMSHPRLCHDTNAP